MFLSAYKRNTIIKFSRRQLVSTLNVIGVIFSFRLFFITYLLTGSLQQHNALTSTGVSANAFKKLITLAKCLSFFISLSHNKYELPLQRLLKTGGRISKTFIHFCFFIQGVCNYGVPCLLCKMLRRTELKPLRNADFYF